MIQPELAKPSVTYCTCVWDLRQNAYATRNRAFRAIAAAGFVLFARFRTFVIQTPPIPNFDAHPRQRPTLP